MEALTQRFDNTLLATTMNKIRSTFKVLLFDTFFFNFAKNIYIQIKLRWDKYVFLSHHRSAEYVNYSPDELSFQRDQGYYSQYGQDFFIWKKYLKNRPTGRFVDIGANRPDVGNNSFFLEKQGWAGVAIDPIKRFQSQWSKSRKTPLTLGAVSNTTREELFVEVIEKQGWEHALSGFKQYVRKEDLLIYDHLEYLVKAMPLSDYLPQNISVEIIMIDVEGAEMEVLEGIDFKQLKPEFVLIENDDLIGGDPKIRRHMSENGYECIARIAATDDLFRGAQT